MSQTIDQVYRDYKTQGVPASGEHEPDKREIRALLKMIQNSGGQAVTRNTLSALNGVTPPTENYMGVVLADPTASNNGYYSRSGGAWVFGRPFPDTFAEVALSGSGTAQAGAVDTGVNPSGVEVFYARVTTPNTGPMTLSISGEAARDVVNLAGNPLSAGEWTGMVMFHLNEDGDYQLLIDAGAAAAAAASATFADGRADDADAAAIRAENAAAAFSEIGTNFKTVANLLADTTVGYTGSGASTEVAAGDIVTAQGFRYEVAASGATDQHVTTAGGVKLYAIGQEIWIEQLGARAGDAAFDNSAIINAALRLTGKNIRAGSGNFRCLSEVDFPEGGGPSEGYAVCSSFRGAGKIETTFDFSEAPDGTVCLSFGGAAVQLYRKAIGGFTIKGKYSATGTTGLKLNNTGSGSNAVTRLHFDDMMLDQHNTALRGDYTWNNLFEAIEIRSAKRALHLATQCNANQFDHLTLLNCEEIAYIQNSEGTLFNTPIFQNLVTGTAVGAAMTLRQSNVVMNNVYIENMDGKDFAFLGGNGDTMGSSLIINGGTATQGGRIRYREDVGHIVRVHGLRNNTFGNRFSIEAYSDSGVVSPLTRHSELSLNVAVGSFAPIPLEAVQSIGRDAVGFANPNNAPVTNTFSTTIARSTGTFQHDVTGLTVGDLYTICLLARKATSAGDKGYIRFRNGGLGGAIVTTLFAPLLLNPDEELDIAYLPIKALGDTMQFIMPLATDIDLYLWRLYKGPVFPPIDAFYR